MRAVDRPDLPRLLHPVAWWVWAVALAAAASRTTNPLLLLLVVAVAAYVVAARRESGTPPVFATFLWLGLFVIVVRVLAQVVLGGGTGGATVLLRLPELPLPDLFGRLRVGGTVTLEEVLFALYDGMRLAAVLACLGAANALAPPRRLLRHVPATLYEVGTAVVVALTYAPQLVDDARRVRRARRLRGHAGRGPRELARLAVPVLEGAMDRALALAAAMESRGYGRAVHRTARSRRAATTLTLVGLGGVVAGLYGLLDQGSPPLLGLPLLLAGVVASGVALVVGARRDPRSRYRPDPWALPEWLVAAAGAAAAAAVVAAAATGATDVVPPVSPARVPELPLLAAAGVLVALAAAWAAPPPPLRAEAAARASADAPAAQARPQPGHGTGTAAMPGRR